MLKVDTELMWDNVDTLMRSAMRLSEISDGLREVNARLLEDGDVFEGSAASAAIRRKHVEEHSENMRMLSRTLENVIELYTRCENHLFGLEHLHQAETLYGSLRMPNQWPFSASVDAYVEPDAFYNTYREFIEPLLSNLE